MLSRRPLRVSVLDAHEIDRAGISSVLGRFGQRITLVGDTCDADVILYGLLEQSGHDRDLDALIRGGSATVILLDWRTGTWHADAALSRGAHGHLCKTMTGEQLVASIERMHRDRERGDAAPNEDHVHPDVEEARLTPREVDMLSLITRGLTNQEIADRVFISINSVKTYIRSAYRKIGVARRAQAVCWGVEHGLDMVPDDSPAELHPLESVGTVSVGRVDPASGARPDADSGLLVTT